MILIGDRDETFQSFVEEVRHEKNIVFSAFCYCYGALSGCSTGMGTGSRAYKFLL
jgi:hypothetical protein